MPKKDSFARRRGNTISFLFPVLEC
ncbi:Protein of unknown function [Pyronema omphalodes CBS 100304]|uniref:Uncharacterized protein n=1 Tax=Pyronema omphalodes (strain CBS 100304) TaxID=1076935 RepID=U4L1G8_PYROM|nr:Protein of unknown function [Pyronema omphalodes CBS 100304]